MVFEAGFFTVLSKTVSCSLKAAPLFLLHHPEDEASNR